jgi:peptidoglycan/LPS O-acetylase OafA/YrhL
MALARSLTPWSPCKEERVLKAGRLRRVDAIDVLRGLAAVTVVLSHYLPSRTVRMGAAVLLMPDAFGLYAVELFFVISGFVIFMTLERCESVGDFALLRFSRLYPAYWTALLVMTCVDALVLGGHVWVGGVLVNATMVQEFVGYPHLDDAYWSLSVELAFYVNVAWLLALGRHRRVGTIVSMWLALSCAWAVMVHDPEASHRDWIARLFALDYAPFFAMGVSFFDLTARGNRGLRALLIPAAIGTEFLISGWEGTAVASVIAGLFFLAVTGRLRFLTSRLTLWLGAISYSLYLIHRNLGLAAIGWMLSRQVPVSVAVAVTVLGALGLATLLTYGVERPALAWIRAGRTKGD